MPLPEAAAVISPLTFRQVFEEHAPYVWRALRGLGVSERDVEDVCQEVFVVIHRKFATYDGQCALRTWIYGICLRTASDYRRRAYVRREQVTDAPPEVETGPEQHERLQHQQACDLLERALRELGDEKRDVFVLYEIEELSLAEIAHVVGCPLQTVYSRLTAARKHVEKAAHRWEREGKSS